MVVVYTSKGNNYFKCTNSEKMYFHATNYSPNSFIELKHKKNDFPYFSLTRLI
jgi:hypothetical protein